MPATVTKRAIARLATKLGPERVAVSNKFRAILGYLLGREWTSPRLVSLAVTSDGFLLGQHAGDLGMNDMLGTAADLRRQPDRSCQAHGTDRDRTQDPARPHAVRLKPVSHPNLTEDWPCQNASR
jgi:hypothetical protein